MSFVAPNWENASEYPPTDGAYNLSFWAWQFLRRNKKYQADWKIYVDKLSEMATRLPELASFVQIWLGEKYLPAEITEKIEYNRLQVLAGQQMEFLQFDPPAISSDATPTAYRKRVLEHGFTQTSQQYLSIAMGEIWGLSKMENPGLHYFRGTSSFLLDGASVHSIGDVNRHSEDINYSTPLLDLRLPIEALRAQFEFIVEKRGKLIKEKNITPYGGRPHRALRLYQNYLRVLDAIDCDTKDVEIAKKILNGKTSCKGKENNSAIKNIGAWKKAAKKIRDETYILLPVYSEMPLQSKAKKKKEIDSNQK